MQTTEYDGETYTSLDIQYDQSTDEFTIMEGTHTGVKFKLADMSIDDSSDSDSPMLTYALESSTDLDLIKPLVDQYLLRMLMSSIADLDAEEEDNDIED